MYKVEESSIMVNYVKNINEKGVGLVDEKNDTLDIYKGLFTSISDFLGQVKNKKEKMALSINDLKGNLKLAAIVAYHPNEENEELPGNWSYEFTTDANDIEGIQTYQSTDPQFQQVLARVLHKSYSITIKNAIYSQVLIFAAITTLLDWLDVNAKEGEEVSIELEGFFVASVAIENGEKIISIVPDGAMKRLIKDDSALELA